MSPCAIVVALMSSALTVFGLRRKRLVSLDSAEVMASLVRSAAPGMVTLTLSTTRTLYSASAGSVMRNRRVESTSMPPSSSLEYRPTIAFQPPHSNLSETRPDRMASLRAVLKLSAPLESVSTRHVSFRISMSSTSAEPAATATVYAEALTTAVARGIHRMYGWRGCMRGETYSNAQPSVLAWAAVGVGSLKGRGGREGGRAPLGSPATFASVR